MLKAVRDLIIVKEHFDPIKSKSHGDIIVPNTDIIVPETVDKKPLGLQGQEKDSGTTRRGTVISAGPEQKEYKENTIVHFDTYAGILIYDREAKVTYVNLMHLEVVAVDTLPELNPNINLKD